MSQVLQLAKDLVSRPSVTPDDAGCQKMIADRLLPLGFTAEWFFCGEVSNLLVTRGQGSPSLWFLGHTDVVPPGAESSWTFPPFEPSESEGKLYGRGVADMKGAVAAMAIALETWAKQNPEQQGQVGLLLTSDEEGVAVDGIVRVAAEIKRRGRAPDYCLVGEPSSQRQLGDTVRIGRRGSIHVRLQVNGIQGHTAFPQHLDNPVHALAPFLNELAHANWDEGNEAFLPTGCQVSNINAGTGAWNVTPENVVMHFNFRNSPVSSSSSLKSRIRSMLERHGITDFELDWRVMGEPFHSRPGRLREAVVAAIEGVLNVTPELNTGGGTSDGRFIAPLGSEVVELGLLNATIHQVDEHTPAADLDRLFATYYDIIRRLL
jgi:succinyl-diaminopimelate desuccinylase